MNVVKCDICGTIVKPNNAYVVQFRHRDMSLIMDSRDVCKSCFNELKSKFEKENNDV